MFPLELHEKDQDNEKWWETTYPVSKHFDLQLIMTPLHNIGYIFKSLLSPEYSNKPPSPFFEPEFWIR